MKKLIKSKITKTKLNSINRIYLIGSEFLKTKFKKGSFFSYNIDFANKKVTINANEHVYSKKGKMCGRKNNNGDIIPLLDISNKEIQSVFDGISKCTVEIYNDEILITPYKEEVNKVNSKTSAVSKVLDINKILRKRNIKYSISSKNLHVLLNKVSGGDYTDDQISMFDLGIDYTDVYTSNNEQNVKCPLELVKSVTNVCTLLSDFKYLELFAGTGIGGKALDDLGCTTIGYSEINKYAIQNYNANFPNRKNFGDIQEIDEKTLPDFDICISGSPCTDISLLKKEEENNIKGIKGNCSKLFFDFIRILNFKKPKWFIFENVRNLLTINNGEDWKIVKSEFEKNYNIQSMVLNTADYGVPQTRRRIYVVGQLKELGDFNFEFPKAIPLTKTVQNDILEKHVDDKYFLTKKMLDTVMKEGTKNWKAKPEINLSVARPLTATMAKMHRASQDSYYSQNYQPLGKTNVRRLTPTEAKRLQGLSDNYKIVVSDTQAYQLMGNAMSYNVVFAVAKALAEYINKFFVISNC